MLVLLFLLLREAHSRLKFHLYFLVHKTSVIKILRNFLFGRSKKKNQVLLQCENDQLVAKAVYVPRLLRPHDAAVPGPPHVPRDGHPPPRPGCTPPPLALGRLVACVTLISTAISSARRSRRSRPWATLLAGYVVVCLDGTMHV